jgi:tRNA A-37 threonylcarbamoyl transferase component Bud32
MQSQPDILLRYFKHVETEEGGALVRKDLEGPVTAALLNRRECQALEGRGGRSVVYRFPLPGGAGILRPSCRGGAVAAIMGDAYLWQNRPLNELLVHAYLYDAGVSVPEPLGAAWTRKGPLVRGAIATRFVNGSHLQDFLAQSLYSTEEMLQKAGRAIREMHRVGVFHADLQIRNILVSEHGVYLIDFDKAVIVKEMAVLQRARNLLRLRRSFQKNRVPLHYFDVLLTGYGIRRLPPWLTAAYTIRGRISDAARGKIRA